MNVLKDKSVKTYDYVSRYINIPYYYNTKDKKYVYGITDQLSDKTSYSEHKVAVEDTLDKLALKYYGRPDYYWIIADFNRIKDPFIKLSKQYTVIKIPALGTISHLKGR